MIINGRSIVFRTSYSETLNNIVEYLRDYSDRYATQFLNDLDDYVLNRIANHPEANPEYKWKRIPQKYYRRGLFRRNYYVIYKVLPKKIELIAIVYARRDLENFEID